MTDLSVTVLSYHKDKLLLTKAKHKDIFEVLLFSHIIETNCYEIKILWDHIIKIRLQFSHIIEYDIYSTLSLMLQFSHIIKTHCYLKNQKIKPNFRQ